MKKLVVPLILAVALGACRNTASEAAEYNDHIIHYQDRIIEAFDNLDSVLRDSTADKAEVDYAFVNLQASVKHGLLVIDSIGPFDRDPTYQKATRELFASYNELIDRDYKKFVKAITLPDSLYTQQVADTANVLKTRIKNHFELATNKFLAEQEMFGKKYKIKFEPNP